MVIAENLPKEGRCGCIHFGGASHAKASLESDNNYLNLLKEAMQNTIIGTLKVVKPNISSTKDYYENEK